MLRDGICSFFIALVLTVLIGLSLGVTSAQVRSSSNYQLQSDSINIGGGLSSSTNFTQESTVGESATGPSDSSTYSLRAGYQQMQEVFISLTAPGDVTMDPNLPGITGGTSNGSTTVTVITDSPSGYQLTIVSASTPAMQRSGGPEFIDDYEVTTYPNPDPSFTIAANEAFFGYSPNGEDIASLFRNNGANCNSGSFTDIDCWYGPSTTAVTISEASGSNHPSGATTTINFRVGVGSSANVTAGLYIATTTLTALPL